MEDYYAFKGINETLLSFSQVGKYIDSEINMMQNICVVSTSNALNLIDTNSIDFSQK